MKSLNEVKLIGNLTRDVEVKHTQTGQVVATLSIATNHAWKDQQGQIHEEPEYHSVVVWGKLAEVMQQYTSKGTKVFVGGRLKTRNWDDANNVKHYRTEIVADQCIILSSSKDDKRDDNESVDMPF